MNIDSNHYYPSIIRDYNSSNAIIDNNNNSDNGCVQQLEPNNNNKNDFNATVVGVGHDRTTLISKIISSSLSSVGCNSCGGNTCSYKDDTNNGMNSKNTLDDVAFSSIRLPSSSSLLLNKKNRPNESLSNELTLNRIMKLSSSSLKDNNNNNSSNPIVLSKKNRSSYTYSLRKTVTQFIGRTSHVSTNPNKFVDSLSSLMELNTATSSPVAGTTTKTKSKKNKRVRFLNDSSSSSSEVNKLIPLPSVVVVKPADPVSLSVSVSDQPLSALTFDNIHTYQQELEDRGYERPPHFFASRTKKNSNSNINSIINNNVTRRNAYCDDSCDTATTCTSSTSSTTSSSAKKLIQFYRRREYRTMWKASRNALEDTLFLKEECSLPSNEEQLLRLKQKLVAQDFYNLFCKVRNTEQDEQNQLFNKDAEAAVLYRWVESDGRGLERPLMLVLGENEDTNAGAMISMRINSLDEARKCSFGRITSDMAHNLALADAKLVQSFYADDQTTL